ncbi:MAG TPA: metallophosphoesterase [Candidatus Methylomirabilis sp.]|nr:metallophosphoesterase [Candidatus Methylomirabilis sp.]
MPFGFRVVIFRLAIFVIVGLAQVYLFTGIRRAIRASKQSPRSQAAMIWLCGSVIGLMYVLNAYIVLWHLPWVDLPLVAQVGLLYPVAVWNFGSVFSAVLLLLMQIAGRVGRLASRGWRRPAGDPVPAPVDMGRRRFLRAGAGSLAAAPLVLSGYGAAYASKAYGVEEVSLPFGRPLRVVQLSDIHAGLYMTREEMRRYADQVNELNPDVLVLTGDFISNSMSFLPGCAEEMARVRTRHGTFATLGNHEHWYGNLREIRAVLGRSGIMLLNNTHQLIRTDMGPFAIAGIDDLATGRPNLDAALRGLQPSIPTLLLSHRPEIFPQAAGRNIPLTLAGHWHGGQIKLSILGVDLSVAQFLSPYPEGLFRIDSSYLYVNRGIGTTGPPIRLNASPEVTLFQLV